MRRCMRSSAPMCSRCAGCRRPQYLWRWVPCGCADAANAMCHVRGSGPRANGDPGTMPPRPRSRATVLYNVAPGSAKKLCGDRSARVLFCLLSSVLNYCTVHTTLPHATFSFVACRCFTVFRFSFHRVSRRTASGVHRTAGRRRHVSILAVLDTIGVFRAGCLWLSLI